MLNLYLTIEWFKLVKVSFLSFTQAKPWEEELEVENMSHHVRNTANPPQQPNLKRENKRKRVRKEDEKMGSHDHSPCLFALVSFP